MKILDLPGDDRPREKMAASGAASLSNAELLAVLLRTGNGSENAVDLSRRLLSGSGGSLSAFAGRSLDSLCLEKGVGKGKASVIMAAMELGRRAFAEGNHLSQRPITTPKDVLSLMLPILKGLSHEECWVLFLNKGHYLTGKERMTSGGLDSTVIDTKQIIKKVVEKGACSIILVHNHPSGDPRPGISDIKATQALKKALSLFNTSLTDHVVIGGGTCYSFADDRVYGSDASGGFR